MNSNIWGTRWFFIGFGASLLTSSIFGSDKLAVTQVRNFSIFYILALVLVVLIYRKWKRIRLNESIFTNNGSFFSKAIIGSIWAVAGHAIGFATIALIRNS
jgi:hypothetical protein